MSIDGSLVALLSAMFLGGFVSGISGFAFSAVAGAILLQVYPPAFAVPLMMACALVAQLYGLLSLRGSMKWREALPLIVGGAVGRARGRCWRRCGTARHRTGPDHGDPAGRARRE